MKEKRRVLKTRYQALSKVESSFYRDLVRNFFNPRAKLVRSFLRGCNSISELERGLPSLMKALKKYEDVYHLIGLKYWIKSFNIIRNSAIKVVNSKSIMDLFKEHTNIYQLPNTSIFRKDKDLFRRIISKMFIASQKTLERVDNDIMKLIGASIHQGHGINQVADYVMSKYHSLALFEAKRIARTETHVVMNTTNFETLKSDKVPRVQWLATDDDRTRESHRKLDGEVVKLGEPFSNGLLHPCDTDGDIEEWINCRCTLLSVYD